jgi:hypothetical protein
MFFYGADDLSAVSVAYLVDVLGYDGEQVANAWLRHVRDRGC